MQIELFDVILRVASAALQKDQLEKVSCSRMGNDFNANLTWRRLRQDYQVNEANT